MSRQGWHAAAARPHGARAYALLVLAVLAGVLAMHGLGPALAPPAAPHSVAASGAHHGVTASSLPHPAATAREDCVHAGHRDSGTGGGHAEHADTTCAAGGTSTAPVLPVPAPAAGADADTDAGPLALATGAAPGPRAPPSLSELQLLRI
ncbi:DUF6153 family protein [Streptomyces sp. NPDC093595]|uniref:DUF6153 family protein n=1 Tax=Streptomyces sp. NPDC093595 TaxID=3366045 RepID=UPI0037F30AAA